MTKLRLFGVYTKNNKIIINDMQYLNKIKKIEIQKQSEEYEEQVCDYLNSINMVILGKINIPKYEFGIICESKHEI